jgi:hypothetical protein
VHRKIVVEMKETPKTKEAGLVQLQPRSQLGEQAVTVVATVTAIASVTVLPTVLWLVLSVMHSDHHQSRSRPMML